MEENRYSYSTESLCPRCLRKIPATITDAADGVVMGKDCPEHGPFKTLVSPDVDTYERIRQTPRRVTRPKSNTTEVEHGCPDDCGLCPVHDQHTCLAVFDITSRCDQGCPVCLAASGPRGRDLELPVIRSALQKLIETEGRPAPLQFSGGEPTQHHDLEGAIRTAVSLGFTKLEVDTNGLALARDPSLAGRLREAGLLQIYLQMDGLEPRVSEFIRGRDLVEDKLRAIENCKRAGIQVALSVTVVPDVNDGCLWEIIRFAMGQRLTGVNFQAVALSGRFPESLPGNQRRLTMGHFMHKLEEQSGGKLLAADLAPIPCPDPRCGALTYALIWKDRLIPLSRLVGHARLRDHLAGMSDWETILGEIESNPAASGGTPAAGLDVPISMDRLFFGSDPFFSIGYHGMMDAYSFDLERVKRCCVHELTPEGKLIPLCLYNIKYRKCD